MKITDFYAARLDEAEAAAHDSGPARVAWLTYRNDAGRMLYTTVAAGEDYGPWAAGGNELPEPAEASVIYDPARVLREVEAQRAILAEHHQDGAGGPCARCATWETPPPGLEQPLGSHFDFMGVMVAWPCQTIRVLVAVYSDHPAYQQEWKPEGQRLRG